MALEIKRLVVKIDLLGKVTYLTSSPIRQYEDKINVLYAWFDGIELGETATVKLHAKNSEEQVLEEEQFFTPIVTTEEESFSISKNGVTTVYTIPSGTKLYKYEYPQAVTTVPKNMVHAIVAYLADGTIFASEKFTRYIEETPDPIGDFVPDVIDTTLEEILASKVDVVDFEALRNGALDFTYAQFEDLSNTGVFYRIYHDNGWWYAETPNGNTLTLGGETQYETTKNTSGVTIDDGSPVMYIGSQGDFMQIAKASASGTPYNVKDFPQAFLGVATETITHNSFGKVSMFGQVKGLVLYGKGAESWVNGTVLYFDPTDGGYTSIRPVAPNPQIIVGIVYKRSSTSVSANGILFVRPSIGYRLRDLHDVLVNGETNGSVLECVDGVWQGSERLNDVELEKLTNQAADLENDVFIYKDMIEMYANEEMAFNSTENMAFNSSAAVSINAAQSINMNAGEDVSINGANVYLNGASVQANGSEVEVVSRKGAANGYAPLGADSKVPSAYVPNSFDDVLEFNTYADLLAYATPTTSKLYVVIADETSGGNHSTYRYSGSIYVRVSDEMSASEVKVLYESNANTNAYTDAEKSKLAGLEDGSNYYDKTYIDGLTDFNGWQKTLLTLTPLTNGQTILTATLSAKDKVTLICKNTSTGEIDTDEVVGSMIVSGVKFVFFDNAGIYLSVGATDSTFTTVAGYELTIYGFNVSQQLAVNVGYDGTGTNYLASETELQGAVSELDSKVKEVDTNSKERDVIFEKRLDEVEELTRKQSSDVASASDTSIISLGKDVAETPLKVQLDGLLLDAVNLPLNPSMDSTSNWSAGDSTLSQSNGIMSITGNGASASSYMFQNRASLSIISNKYYLGYKARVTNSSALRFRVRLNLTASNDLAQETPTINTWYTLSAIYTANASGTMSILPTHVYVDSATANGKVMEVDYVHVFNISTLIANKQYSPIFNTTFDLMTDANIKTQMDSWIADGTLPNNIQAVDMQKRVKSVGKNLFDGKFELGNINFSTGVNESATDRIRTVNYIQVKPSTAYMLSLSSGVYTIGYRFYNKDKVYLSSVGQNDGITFTTPSDCFYLKYVVVANTNVNDLAQLELGSTATTYTPYRSSELYLNGNSKGYKLPNLVQDTVEMRNGKAYKVQRVQKYTLQASDITTLTTSATGVDYATSITFADGLISNSSNTHYYSSSWNRVSQDNVDYAVGTYAGYIVRPNSTSFRFIVAKGTYANLAAAQTALAGTVIYYQLATPIETEISSIGNAMAYPNGSVYVEQATSDYGIYGTNLAVSNSNYPILALDEIYKLNADGSSTKLANSSATISGDKLSFTHTSLSAGDSAWFSYYYYSSVPNIMGRTTVYFYDDKLIVTDSVTSTVYRLVPTIASGVLSWTLVAI